MRLLCLMKFCCAKDTKLIPTKAKHIILSYNNDGFMSKEYIEATLNNTFSYYYPFYNEKVLGDYQFYIKGAPVATGYFDIHYITPVKIRTVLAEYAQIWKKVPGFSQLVDPGFYTWILLLLAGYLIYRKRTSIARNAIKKHFY